LETGSLTVELTPLHSSGDRLIGGWAIFTSPDHPIARSPDLFHFLVRRMLPATLAKFLDLQPVWSRLAIFRRRVIALFAITALHRNNFSRHETQLLAASF
jgi:hypothetical protein